MDAHYYMADDDRPSLTEPDPPDCEDCGVGPDEPCLTWCACTYCIEKRARSAACPDCGAVWTCAPECGCKMCREAEK